MCFSPVRILNPSRSYRSDVPKYLYVPCGHCQDCQRVKHNEWFFRAMIEWNYYRAIGGSVYFITLTYNDNDLPKCSLPSGEVITGFDKRHIHNFIKYLRILLARSHLEHRDIKYLICSEYSDKNTKRPHYHGLLFFPYHIPCVGHKSFFNRIIERAWQHGWIVCSEFGWEIKSSKGIRYATKYVCKDIGFYNDVLSNYLRNVTKDNRKELMSYIKDYLPKHWQSVGFGSPFLDVIQSQPDIAQYLFRDSYRLNIDKSPDFKIPRYYHLKLEKKVAKDISKLLDKVVMLSTQVGKDVRLMRLHKSLDTFMVKLRDFSQPSFLDSLYPDECCYNVARDWFKCSYRTSYVPEFLFDDYDSVRNCTIDFIRTYLPRFDLNKFAVYSLFLRYLPLFDDDVPESKFDDVEFVFNRMVDSPCVPPEIYNLGLCSNADYVATPLKDNEDARKQKMCCNHPYFSDYETLALAFDRFNLVKNIVQDYTAWKKEDDKRKIKAWKPNKIHKYKSNDSI